jgi:hypothetical protein
LANASVSYSNVEAPAGTPATIKVGETVVNIKYPPEDIAAAKAKAEEKLAALNAAEPRRQGHRSRHQIRQGLEWRKDGQRQPCWVPI